MDSGAAVGPNRNIWKNFCAIGTAISACAALVLALPLSAPAAHASTGYDHVGEFGGQGTGDGLFGTGPSPGRVDVHEESGKIFAVDTGNHRIQVFDPEFDEADSAYPAGFAFEFDELDDGSTIDTPIGIAIDQDTSQVYVSIAGPPPSGGGNGTIVRFNPEGDPADPIGYEHDPTFSPQPHPFGPEPGSFGQPGAFDTEHRGGIAVDPTTGDVLLADAGGNRVWRWDSAGVYTGPTFPFTGDDSGEAFAELYDIAVDSEGEIIVSDGSGAGVRIERFDADGNHLGTLPLPPTWDNSNVGATVAANPATDEVMVGSVPDGSSARVAQFENDILVNELDAPGGRFNGFILGIGLRGEEPGGRLYAMASDGFFGTPRVQVFDAFVLPDPPAVTIDPPDPRAIEADFSGAVDHQDAETTWWFEYGLEGTDPATWEQVDDGDGELDGTEQPVPVEVDATATGLEPNTDYEVRLVAENAGGATTSPVESFTTDSVAPVVTTDPAAFITDTEATLRGRVNPRNAQTSYWFEWGTDTTYGNVVPVTAGDAGDGGSPVAVSAEIDGLEPDTVYHYRLVAENEFGQGTEGDDRSFATLVERAGLGPARAYELVSPVPTGGIPVWTARVAVSADGERATFSTRGLPRPEADGQHFQYLAQRDPDGWVTQVADPQPQGVTWTAGFTRPGAFDDLSRIVITTQASLDPDDQNVDPEETFPSPAEGSDVYVRGLDEDEWTWVTRDPRGEPGEEQTDVANAGDFDWLDGGPSMMSSDGGVIAFNSNRSLDDAHASGTHVYKWSDGELEFLGVRPDGTVAGGSTIAGPDARALANNAVARDGSRVIVRTQAPGQSSAAQALYVHTDGEPIVEATAEQGVTLSGAAHPRDTVFGGASSDVSRLFFTSASRLTPDSGASHTSNAHSDLYVFDLESGTLRNLTPRLDGVEDSDLTNDPDVADRARVLGVAAISQDARRVYFVADGQLDAAPSPLGETPSADGRNLYLAELDEIDGDVEMRFIAGSLGPNTNAGDARIWRNPAQGGARGREAHASPDGAVLAFSSIASLTDDPDGDMRQAYAYDASERSLACASCPPDGSDPTGPVRLRAASLADGGVGESPQGDITKRRWVTADGTLYFNTTTPLLPEDTNDAHDVYEYRAGELRLVSAGDGPRHSTFVDASADGSTVFFRTADALSAHDDEPGVHKIYAARVGGGFPAPPPPPPECVGDGCQDPPAPAPEAERPGSADAVDPGNPPEAAIAAQRLNRKQARRLARGKRIGLRAEVSGPGRVAAVIRARLRPRGGMVRVGRAVTQAQEAGGVVVRGLRLNRRAQRALRQQGRMVVRVIARYRGETSGQRVRLGNRNRLQRRAQRLRQRAQRQAQRGNRARAQRLRQRAQRLKRQSRRLNRPIGSTAGGQR